MSIWAGIGLWILAAFGIASLWTWIMSRYNKRNKREIAKLNDYVLRISSEDIRQIQEEVNRQVAKAFGQPYIDEEESKRIPWWLKR